jgi:hypothetical protein
MLRPAVAALRLCLSPGYAGTWGTRRSYGTWVLRELKVSTVPRHYGTRPHLRAWLDFAFARGSAMPSLPMGCDSQAPLTVRSLLLWPFVDALLGSRRSFDERGLSFASRFSRTSLSFLSLLSTGTASLHCEGVPADALRCTEGADGDFGYTNGIADVRAGEPRGSASSASASATWASGSRRGTCAPSPSAHSVQSTCSAVPAAVCVRMRAHRWRDRD